MKLPKLAIGVFGAGVCAALTPLGVIGCAMDTEAKRAEARGAATEFRAQLSEMPARIDATTSKLLALSDNRSTDKAKALAEFRHELARMDSDARVVSREAERARRDADAYFQQWARDRVATDDPVKRKEAAEAMAAKRASYDTATSYLEEARRHYTGLSENLHAIERMYAGGGVDGTSPAVRSAVERAIQDAVDVKNYIDRLDEQIDAVLGIT